MIPLTFHFDVNTLGFKILKPIIMKQWEQFFVSFLDGFDITDEFWNQFVEHKTGVLYLRVEGMNHQVSGFLL